MKIQIQKKTASTILAIGAVFALFASTACGPAALEAKRLADQCNATYGFNTPKSISCTDTGFERIAMASATRNVGLSDIK